MRLRGQVIVVILLAAFVLAPLRAHAEVVEPIAPPGGTASSAGSLIYVTSPSHLASLTREDAPLHQRAVAVANRAKFSAGVLMGSLALGALLIVGAGTIFTKTECIT